LFLLTDTPTTEIYTLSLHDALPILEARAAFIERNTKTAEFVGQESTGKADFQPAFADGIQHSDFTGKLQRMVERRQHRARNQLRSEEHTSELQSQSNLVCRLLLEKK